VRPLFKRKAQGQVREAPYRQDSQSALSCHGRRILNPGQSQQTVVDNAGEIQMAASQTYLSKFGGLLQVPLESLEGHIVVLEIGAMALAATALQSGVGGLLIGRRMGVVVVHGYVIVVWNVACASGARMMDDSAVTEGIDGRAAPRMRMACAGIRISVYIRVCACWGRGFEVGVAERMIPS
jgi:hypothetical protein